MLSILADVSRLREKGREVDSRNTFIDGIFGVSVEKSVQDLRLLLSSEVTHATTLQLLRTYSWDIVDQAFQSLSTVYITVSSGIFDLILLIHKHERIAEWEVLTFDLAYQAINTAQFSLSMYMIQLLLVTKGTDRLLNKAFGLVLRRVKVLLKEHSSWMESLVLACLYLILGITSQSLTWSSDIMHIVTTFPYPTPNTYLIYFLQQSVALFVSQGLLLSSIITSSVVSVYVWLIEERWAEYTYYSLNYLRYAHCSSIISSLHGRKVEDGLFELLPSKYRQATISALQTIIPSSSSSSGSRNSKSDLLLWSDIISYSLPSSRCHHDDAMDNDEEKEEEEVIRADGLGIAAIYLFITCSSSFSSLLPLVYSPSFIRDILINCLHIISASSQQQTEAGGGLGSLASYELYAISILYPDYGHGGITEMVTHTHLINSNNHSNPQIFLPYWRKITSSAAILDSHKKSSFKVCHVVTQSTEIWTFVSHFLHMLADCRDKQLRKIAYFSFRLYLLDLHVIGRFGLLVSLINEGCLPPHIVCVLVDTVKDNLQVDVKKLESCTVEEVMQWKGKVLCCEELQHRLDSLCRHSLSSTSPVVTTSVVVAAEEQVREVAKQLLTVYHPVNNSNTLSYRQTTADDLDFQLLHKAVATATNLSDREGMLWSVIVFHRLFLHGLDSVLIHSPDQIIEQVDVHISKLNLLTFICLRLIAASNSINDFVWIAFFEHNPENMTIILDTLAILQAWHSRLIELQQSSMIKELSPLEDMKFELLRSTVQFVMEKLAIVIAMMIMTLA